MPISDEQLHRHLEIAGSASRRTRDLLREGRRARTLPRSQIGRDIKLEEDVRSEAVIRAYLAEHSPFPVLGEEGGWGQDTGAQGEPSWVVDPLDGSFNYHRGVPIYAVAIALCIDRTPLVGAIYDPERDELFTGGPKLGFSVNGERREPDGVPGQMLATGFPSQADVNQASSRIAELAQEWTKIRMLGSAAISLAWVAAGRLDGYAETGVMWWDVAAGLALAQGAGLRTVTVRPLTGHGVDVLVAR